jgi:hypothetical protein
MTTVETGSGRKAGARGERLLSLSVRQTPSWFWPRQGTKPVKIKSSVCVRGRAHDRDSHKRDDRRLSPRLRPFQRQLATTPVRHLSPSHWLRGILLSTPFRHLAASNHVRHISRDERPHSNKVSSRPRPWFTLVDNIACSSFAIVHSLADETLSALYDKLTRKVTADYLGARVTAGWLKYEWRDTVWNLDDGKYP